MKNVIEWIGTHPFATGILAVIGLLGTLIGTYDVVGSTLRDSETSEQLSDISSTTEQTAEDAAASRSETEAVSLSIEGLADRLDSVEERALEQETAANDYIPPVMELPYDIARPKLLNVGWIPIKTRWQNIGQYEFRVWPLWHHGFEEISSCAGSGRGECRFEFHNGSGTRLIVVSFGEIPNETDGNNAFVGRPNFGNFRVNEAWLEETS